MTKEAKHKGGKAVAEAQELFAHFDHLQKENAHDLSTLPDGSTLREVLMKQQEELDAYKKILKKMIERITKNTVPSLGAPDVVHLRDAFRDLIQATAHELTAKELVLIEDLMEIARNLLDPPYKKAILEDAKAKLAAEKAAQLALQEAYERAKVMVGKEFLQEFEKKPTAIRLETPKNTRADSAKVVFEESTYPGITIQDTQDQLGGAEDTLEIVPKAQTEKPAFFSEQKDGQRPYEIRFSMQRGATRLMLAIEVTKIFAMSMEQRLIHESGMLIRVAQELLLKLMPEIKKKPALMTLLFEGESQGVRVKKIEF